MIASLTDPLARRALSVIVQRATPEGVLSASAETMRALVGLGSRQAWLRLREALKGLGALTYAQGGGSESSTLTLTAAGLEAGRAFVPDTPADRSADTPADSPTRAAKSSKSNEVKESSPLPLPQPQRAKRTGRPDRWAVVEALVAEVRALRRELAALVLAVAAGAPVAPVASPPVAAPSPGETRPPAAPVERPKERRVVRWDPDSPEGKPVLARVAALCERDPRKDGPPAKPRDARFMPMERVEKCLKHALLMEAEGKARSEAGLFWGALYAPDFEFCVEASLPWERVLELAEERRLERDAKPSSVPKKVEPDAGYLALIARPSPPIKAGAT